MIEAVIGEALFPLQIENKCPDFMLADLSYIFAFPVGGEKFEKVVHAVGNDGDGIGAFTFGSGTELVTMK